MRRVGTALFVVVIALVGVFLWITRPREAGQPRHVVPGEDGRIVVEVLNGTRVDGLARSITRLLRRQGIDVVYFGTADTTGDTTRIVIRRGDSTAAIRIQRLLGLGRVVSEPNANLLLDATVILGQDAAALRGLEP